jgi:tetratricopeptide (TPR) repeat protein
MPSARTHSTVTFDGAALQQLRVLAQRVRAAGPETVLMRGVLLHTDIVTVWQDAASSSERTEPSMSAPFRVFSDDGRLTGVSSPSEHWNIARMLASLARHKASIDPWVRAWYRATAAYLQYRRHYGSEQLDEGLRAFPMDAELLFLAGCDHEALASASVQTLVRAVSSSSRIVLPVESEDRELEEAELLFTGALAVDSSLVEARIRLGRVVGLQGRHSEATKCLRNALHTAREPLLRYYAALFLGSELRALDDDSGAGVAFAQAASLYPQAPSANLALAQLAWRHGDRQEMTGRLRRALADNCSRVGQCDPWDSYFIVQGRAGRTKLDSLRESVSRKAQ